MAEKAEEDLEQMAKDICSVLDRALADFDQMRTREGERLKEDVLSRAAVIEEKVTLVEIFTRYSAPVPVSSQFPP